MRRVLRQTGKLLGWYGLIFVLLLVLGEILGAVSEWADTAVEADGVWVTVRLGQLRLVLDEEQLRYIEEKLAVIGEGVRLWLPPGAEALFRPAAEAMAAALRGLPG